MVKIGPLAADQRQALERLRRARRRAGLAARAYGAAQRPRVHRPADSRQSSTWARTWCALAAPLPAGGPRGLDDRPRPGRPPQDRLARQIVDTQASNPPRNSGLVQSCWTAGLLAAFLAARFGLVLSRGSVRRYSARDGLALGAAPSGPRDARARGPAQGRSGSPAEAEAAGAGAGHAQRRSSSWTSASCSCCR